MGWLGHFALLLAVTSAPAQQPPTPPAPPPTRPKIPALKDLPLFAGGSVDALAGSLRGYLVHNLPTPLYEKSWNWGHTVPVANGLKWRGQGLGVHPEVQHAPRKDGHWRKVTLTAENPADTVVFDIRDVALPETGRMTFKVFVSLDTRVDYQQQSWHAGKRTYSGSAAAHLRLKLLLDLEATTTLASGPTLVPDVVFRLHVTHADLSYDNLRFEHIAGIGGEGAKLLGDAVKGSLREWRPSLEADLLAKANRAIVKAGDTKEIRLSLSRLFSAGQAKAAPPAKPQPVAPAGK